MSEEDDSISRLASQTKNIGYYAGLTFGVGYCLVLIGVIAVIAEIIVRYSSGMSGYWGYVGVQTPPWLTASMLFFAIGIICAVYFGFTVVKNSKSARDHGLKIDTIASSVSAFSFTLIFMGIGITIVEAGLRLSLFSPICGVVGPILLLIGFRAYHGKASESKLIGAIIMLVSIALIYFVAYRGIGVGPLLSESTLEAIALLITIVGAVIFSFPILVGELKQSVAGIILSISGILFSCGVMYFNFKAVSDINNMLSLLSGIGGYSYGYGFPSITLNSIWIMFFGFLLLGISGIIGLVTACLPLAISAKQLSTRLEAPRPKTPEGAPPKSSEVKYCSRCGTSMPLDSIYCPKCGQKQPAHE